MPPLAPYSGRPCKDWLLIQTMLSVRSTVFWSCIYCKPCHPVISTMCLACSVATVFVRHKEQRPRGTWQGQEVIIWLGITSIIHTRFFHCSKYFSPVGDGMIRGCQNVGHLFLGLCFGNMCPACECWLRMSRQRTTTSYPYNKIYFQNICGFCERNMLRPMDSTGWG